jgi:hypothetical protein
MSIDELMTCQLISSSTLPLKGGRFDELLKMNCFRPIFDELEYL